MAVRGELDAIGEPVAKVIHEGQGVAPSRPPTIHEMISCDYASIPVHVHVSPAP